MDAMDQLLAEGYTHYQFVYYIVYDDETFEGAIYPIEPLETTAQHFIDNFETSADLAEVKLFKLVKDQ